MALKTAVQLYTFRHLDISLPAIIELTGQAGFDGVELAFRARDSKPERVTEALEATDQEIAGAHVPLDQFEQDPEEVITFYETLGCDRLITYTLDDGHFASRADTMEFVDRIQRLADVVNQSDLEFCYHNHDVEFTEVEGTPAFDILLDELEGVAWEIDAGWAAAGGYDPIEVIGQPDDVRSVHAKDMNMQKSTPVEIGNGDVDLPAVAEAAHGAGADWIVYEHDFADAPLLSVDRGAETLHGLVEDVTNA